MNVIEATDLTCEACGHDVDVLDPHVHLVYPLVCGYCERADLFDETGAALAA